MNKSVKTLPPPRGNFYLSLLAGKLTRSALRLFGREGTNLPGKIALRLCPDFLALASKPDTVVTVTGTNGKTTTTNLLRDILTLSGVRVLSNALGSNTDTGIASALLSGLTLKNRCKYPVAVLEVDERSSRVVYPAVTPDYTVILNLSRDSIMRNPCPQYMAELLTRSIPPSTRLILNADDLISCRVAPKNPRVYFSLADTPLDKPECEGRVNDLRLCPECSAPLVYSHVRAGHIGRARCPVCGLSSPECSAPLVYSHVRAGHIGRARCPVCGLSSPEGDLVASVRGRKLVLATGGTYPIPPKIDPYDALASLTLLRTLGLPQKAIARALGAVRLPSTRRAEMDIGGVRVVAHMAKDKNAAACSRCFRELLREPGGKELLLMMNCLYDQSHWSENVCWLYDCDFEVLNAPSVKHIVAAGPRCLDYRLRLLLAGIPEEKIDFEPDERRAVDLMRLSPGQSAYILYGTDSVRLAAKIAHRAERVIRGRGK